MRKNDVSPVGTTPRSSHTNPFSPCQPQFIVERYSSEHAPATCQDLTLQQLVATPNCARVTAATLRINTLLISICDDGVERRTLVYDDHTAQDAIGWPDFHPGSFHQL